MYSVKEDITTSLIKSLAHEEGLTFLGSVSCDPLHQEKPRLILWQESGFAGEMGFMNRDAELLTAPKNLLPEGQSILSFAVRYAASPRSECPPGFGRVARYAWGRDYHRVIKKRLLKFMARLEGVLEKEIIFRVFSDSVPLLERAIAANTGEGFIGRNTMFIRPGIGSYFFLAEVICNLKVRSEGLTVIQESSKGGCGTCRQCLDACPTNAIVEEFKIDARRCISYLTIEKEGNLLEYERSMLGEWVFGCDRCQEVCPFNHASMKRDTAPDVVEFEPERGAGDLLSLSALLDIRSDEEYLERFAGTPLMRPGREGLLRNAACVAGNTLARAAEDSLERARSEDVSPVVRECAAWALSKIGSTR